MIKRLFGIFACVLVSVALFRSFQGLGPLKAVDFLSMLSTLDYDYTEFYEIFDYFADFQWSDYFNWLHQDLEWYEYITILVRIIWNFFEIFVDITQVVIVGLWNLVLSVVHTLYVFVNLIFRVVGFIN